MIKSPVFPAAICSLCAVLPPLLEYIGGRAGHPLHIFLIPLAIFPFLGWAIFGIWALGWMAFLIFRRRRYVHILLSATFIATSVVMPRFLSRLLPTSPFLKGFYSRISSQVTPDQLRAIAAQATKIMGAERTSLASPTKFSLWDEKADRPLWTKLAATPGVDRLDQGLLIQSINGWIELEWGGALMGHWGIRIQSPEVSEIDDYAYWAPLPDIAVFMHD